jgi:hypothetical protein
MRHDVVLDISDQWMSSTKWLFACVQHEVKLAPGEKKMLQADITYPSSPRNAAIDDFTIRNFPPTKEPPITNCSVRYLKNSK